MVDNAFAARHVPPAELAPCESSSAKTALQWGEPNDMAVPACVERLTSLQEVPLGWEWGSWTIIAIGASTHQICSRKSMSTCTWHALQTMAGPYADNNASTSLHDSDTKLVIAMVQGLTFGPL